MTTSKDQILLITSKLMQLFLDRIKNGVFLKKQSANINDPLKFSNANNFKTHNNRYILKKLLTR